MRATRGPQGRRADARHRAFAPRGRLSLLDAEGRQELGVRLRLGQLVDQHGHRIEHVELPLSLTRSGDSTISIKNNTTATLPVVVVRGAGDDYYVTAQLAAGATVAVDSSDPLQAASKIAKVMTDYRPAVPPGLGEGGSLLDFGTGARVYSMTVGASGFRNGDILNRTFDQWMSDKVQLPQFGFSLLATESNAVEVPLDGKRADDLHLMVGVQTW